MSTVSLPPVSLRPEPRRDGARAPNRRALALRTVALRIGAFLATLVLATFVAFLLIKLVPGDPATAIAGENATPERLAEIRAQLGLDQPLLVQYGGWALSAVQGDFGTSLYSGQSVAGLIAQRLPVTLSLVACSLVLAIVVGMAAGIIGAMRAERPSGRIVTGVATLGIAIPNFWLGLVLVTLFALWNPWFPATGFSQAGDGLGEFLRFAILPTLALGAAGVAEVARQLRGALLEVLTADYIRMARSKGISRSALLLRHALRNAGVPIVTVLGLLINRLVGGTVVVEVVFAIPGMGTLVIDAVNQRDYPVIQAVVLVMAVIVLVANAIVEILYRRIDPRIRLS
ncbi:MAG: ABC transporter permease [Pseudonocardia sp.]|nr:ABC transporter permease [Pseudonocardia sp.]